MSEESVVDPKGNVLGEGLPLTPPGTSFADLRGILPPPPPGPPVPIPKLSDYVRNLDGSPLTEEQQREIEAQERELASEITPFLGGEADETPLGGTPLPLSAPKPGNAHPPFELPAGDEEAEGHVPSMHTVEQDRQGGRSQVHFSEMEAEYERTRVEKAKKYLNDVSLIADDIVLTVENLVNAFKHKGFTNEVAYDFAKLIIEKKLQPFL